LDNSAKQWETAKSNSAKQWETAKSNSAKQWETAKSNSAKQTAKSQSGGGTTQGCASGQSKALSNEIRAEVRKLFQSRPFGVSH